MLTRATLLLMPIAFLAQGPAILRWTPKEGDVVEYRTTGDMSFSGIEAKITTLIDQKVIRVDPDGGFLVQATPLQNRVTLGGQEMTGQGITILTTYAPNGEIKEIRGDKADATGYRMANLTNFHAPTKGVAVGDSWTSTGVADPKTGAVGWKADYKVIGEETIAPFLPALKIEVTARETEGSEGGKATGNVWVGKDGILVKSSLTWSNVTVPGAPAPVSGTILVVRVPIDAPVAVPTTP